MTNVSKVPFTETSLKGVKYATGATLKINSSIPGFHLAVGKKSKIFKLEKRIKGDNGSARTFSLGTFSKSTKTGKAAEVWMTIEEAKELALDYIKLCDAGIDPTKHQDEQPETIPTLEDIAFRYLGVRQSITDESAKLITKAVQDFGDLAKIPVDQITVDQCLDLHASIHHRGPTAAYSTLRWMCTLLNFHFRLRCVTFANPASVALAECASKAQPRKTRLKKHQVGAFIVRVESARNAKKGRKRGPFNAVLLCLYTGMRIGEALGLHVDQIHDDGIHLTKTKNGRSHHIPLSTQAMAVLNDALANREGSHLVFPLRRRALSRGDVGKAIKSLELGYDFTAHGCRRTFASACSKIGISWIELKRMLNHKFKGGVTGGYIDDEYDDAETFLNFQRIGDHFEKLKIAALDPDKCEGDVRVAHVLNLLEDLSPSQIKAVAAAFPELNLEEPTDPHGPTTDPQPVKPKLTLMKAS